MKPSLSVILPVQNAEGTLAAIVGKLLDLLPDLATRFEIVIVDDGSTDHTAEIADDLRRKYPQVKVARHGWQWGRAAAVRTGRLHTRGDVVVALHSQCDVNSQELAQQWQSMADAARLDVPPLENVDPEPTLHVLRPEPAHVNPALQKEPSFLQHLRQLSRAH